MKIPVLRLVGAGLVAVLLFLHPKSAESAIFYENSNFKKLMLVTSWKSSQLGRYNDRLTSVIVGDGECVVLFADSLFRGRNLFLSSSVERLGQQYNFNDKASSYVIYQAGVDACNPDSVAWVYRYANQAGRKMIAPPGILMSNLESFNDEASSVRVPDGFCLRMWRDASNGLPNNFYPDVIYTSGDHNLTGFNNQASAFELQPLDSGWCEYP
jgi:hypothetical protein